MIVTTLTLLLFLLTIPFFLLILCRIRFSKLRSISISKWFNDTNRNHSQTDKVIAFFHPHCSAGGGGERVLWKIVQILGEMQNAGMPIRIAIYTTDEPHDSYRQDVMNHVSSRFSIHIPSSLPLVFVHLHEDVNPKPAGRFTMIYESLASIRLSWKALQKLTPHVYIDTTGAAFTFLVAKLLAGCKVGAYVHYPTISTDMLSLVYERRPSYNNTTLITSNTLITYLKLLYYTFFAVCYGLVGSLATFVMVNSSWTYQHITYLWRFAHQIDIVYPPCDTTQLQDLPLSRKNNIILSIGQFRPEKDHVLQLRSFAILLDKLKRNDSSSSLLNNVKLVLIGGCRNKTDQELVESLQHLVQTLEISHAVEFVLNQPYGILKQWLRQANIGLHTMWNEHFGIGVVEMMAAGLITIAHNSGGPKMDILVPCEGQRTGYLAITPEEYANVMYDVLMKKVKDEDLRKMRCCARESAKRFSDEVFCTSFKKALFSSDILK